MILDRCLVNGVTAELISTTELYRRLSEVSESGRVFLWSEFSRDPYFGFEAGASPPEAVFSTPVSPSAFDLNRFKSNFVHFYSISAIDEHSCVLHFCESSEFRSLTCLLSQPNMCGNARNRLFHRPDHLALPHHRETGRRRDGRGV